MKTKRWITMLLALLLALGLMPSALAAEEKDPVGVVANNVYYNEALGLCMTLPDTWCFLSDAELAERMGYESQYASRQGLRQLLEQDSTVCTMFANASDDASWTANLTVQDLGIYRSLDENTFFDLAKDGLIEAQKAQGFTDVQLTKSSFQLAGQDHVGAVMTGKMGLLQTHMILVLVKGDRYLGSLTAAAFTQQKAEEVLQYFTAITSDTNIPAAPSSTNSASTAAPAADDSETKYAKAKEAMENKLYYTAYNLFTELGSYKDAASLASKCQRPTPDTGELSRNSDYKRKTCRLNLKNKLKGGYNIYVRIYDSTGNVFVSSTFIRSSKGAVIYLPEDTFLIKAAYGKGAWYGEQEMFGDDAIYKELFTATLTNAGRYRTWVFEFEDELDYKTITREEF